MLAGKEVEGKWQGLAREVVVVDWKYDFFKLKVSFFAKFFL
jgi:hypothetical protein